MKPWVGWSYLLTAVGVTGLLLAGSKRKLGWAIGLGAQVLWIAYALATEQYGFLISAVVYGTVYARNWWRWWQEEPERDEKRRKLRQVASDLRITEAKFPSGKEDRLP